MHLRPRPPLPRAAEVQRRERSWVFTAGRRHFSFTRIDYATAFSAGHRIEAAAPRAWRPSAIIGAMLAVLGGATLVALAMNSSRAAAGYRYVVSVPIPPLRAAAMPAAPTTLKAKPAPLRVAAASPAAIRPQAPRSTFPSDYTVGALDSPEDTAAVTTMTGAVRAAMATGHLQQWSSIDGSERGFVVVGPLDGGSRGCRSLSILTRRDGENHVESRRECGKSG